MICLPATVPDLIALGIAPDKAALQADGGPALTVRHDGRLVAAGGCFLHGKEHRLGELWFAAVPGCPPVAVRPLLRLLDLWTAQRPHLVLVMFRGKDAVAFERLALLCGLQVQGDCAWATP